MNKPHINTVQYLAITQAKYLDIMDFHAIHYGRIKRILVLFKIVTVSLFSIGKVSLVIGNVKFKEFVLLQKILGNKLKSITLVLDFYNENVESISILVNENKKIEKLVILGNSDLLIGLKRQLKDPKVILEFVKEKTKSKIMTHSSILSIKPLYQFTFKQKCLLISDAISIRKSNPELNITFHPRTSRVSVFVWLAMLGNPYRIINVDDFEFDSCVFFGAYSNFMLSASASNIICLTDLSSHPQYDKFMDTYYAKEPCQ